MKKILIFSLSYFPYVGGAEIAIKEITDRIPDAHISFDMVTLRFNSSDKAIEKIGNITVYRVGGGLGYLSKILFPVLAALKAKELNKSKSYDLWWGMMSFMGLPISVLRLLGVRKPYVLTLQDGDPIDSIKTKMLPVYPLFVSGFKNATFVQAISTFLASWGREMGSKNTVVIPNGVNTNAFMKEYSPEELNSLKERLGKKEGDVFLITTSRLVAKNGIKDVIHSLKSLPEYVRFLIIGSGPLLSQLKKVAQSSGVESRVKFLGEVSNKEIPLYLNVSDIFVRPSLSEGQGISFIEAMAAGIPIVATHVGGITDFLFDPEKNKDKKPTGRVAVPHDPESIASAVLAYLSNKSLTEEIIRNAQELVKEKYDWEIIIKEMRDKAFSI